MESQQAFELSVNASARLKELAESCGVPPAIVLCAAASVLVSRCDLRDAGAIGLPRQSGDRDAIRPATGSPALLVFAADLSDAASFREIVDRARRVLAEHRFAPEPSSARPGSFELWLQWPSSSVLAPVLDDAPLDATLTLWLDCSDPVIRGALRFTSAAFDRRVIERLAAHFAHIATRVTADPDRSVSDAEILDDAEREELLAQRSDARRGCLGETAHEIFQRQVERAPDAIALVWLDEAMTYAALNARANRLARRLRAMGVGPEVPVGLCLRRSIDAVVTIFAILKAGGAYVPLDPTYPPERLAEIIRDSSMPLAITTNDLVEHLPRRMLPLLVLNSEVDRIASESSTDLPPSGRWDNAAYVLYTSGSTGKPKGIVGCHGSIVNGLCWPPFHADDETDVCCVNSALSVAFTTARLFLPLLCGRRLVIIPEGDEKDLRRLVSAWEFARVGNIAMMSPLLRQFLDAGHLIRRLGLVRTVVFGGAPVARQTIAAFLDAMPHAEVLHGYASTEAGGAVLVHSIRSAASPWSVGRPFPNTRVYILDNRANLMPIGAVGELCISAPHMARGYLRQPGLTAERFVANPFGHGERLFRTGDLARYLSNGEIEILGRTDDQVKIRGFRVELRDVELPLAEHAGVQQVTVTAREMNGETRLVAFVVRGPGSLASSGDLRNHLAQRLPDYMIPSLFAFVDSLPMTSSGKVDRAALPRLETPSVATEDVPPRNELEADIADVWRTELALDRVGVHEHLLDVGGDSLSAMQIAIRLTEKFGVDIVPASVIVDYPTVAEMAAYIAAHAEPSPSNVAT